MFSNASSSLHQLGEVQHLLLLHQIQATEASGLWTLLQEVSRSPAPHVRFVALWGLHLVWKWARAWGWLHRALNVFLFCLHPVRLQTSEELCSWSGFFLFNLRYPNGGEILGSRNSVFLLQAARSACDPKKKFLQWKNQHPCSILLVLEITKALWNILLHCCQLNDSVCKINSHQTLQ